MDRFRDIVFVCLIGFIVASTVLSAYGMIQAIGGFSDTYAALVASYPTLATEEARQERWRASYFSVRLNG
jgi:hypothetical protein